MKITKKKMDAAIKIMAKRQNPKRKLNAGQLREAIRLFILAVNELENDKE